jgi:hypothetical protein
MIYVEEKWNIMKRKSNLGAFFAHMCVGLNFTDPKSIIFLLNYLHLILSSVQFSSPLLLKESLNGNSTAMI